MAKAGRKQIDWELVEREYRAGKLSIREIARVAGCAESMIRKKAKAEGWYRDLSAKIDEQVRNKLVRSEVRTPAATEREIIEAASDTNVAIITLQRKDVTALRDHEERLFAELEKNPTKLYITQYKGKIIQKEVGLSVTEKAQILQILSTVRDRRVNLERIVFNIDGSRDKGKTALSEILDEIGAAGRRLPSNG